MKKMKIKESRDSLDCYLSIEGHSNFTKIWNRMIDNYMKVNGENTIREFMVGHMKNG